MRADVHRFSLKDPSDVSGLCAGIDKGLVDPAKIVNVCLCGCGFGQSAAFAIVFAQIINLISPDGLVGSLPLRIIWSSALECSCVSCLMLESSMVSVEVITELDRPKHKSCERGGESFGSTEEVVFSAAED